MAPKLSRSMDDARIPGAYGGEVAPPAPTGRASEMPQGLLPKNGTLVPPLGKTSAMGDAEIYGGNPTSNRRG
jgi:hypothetical protein